MSPLEQIGRRMRNQVLGFLLLCAFVGIPVALSLPYPHEPGAWIIIVMMVFFFWIMGTVVIFSYWASKAARYQAFDNSCGPNNQLPDYMVTNQYFATRQMARDIHDINMHQQQDSFKPKY